MLQGAIIGNSGHSYHNHSWFIFLMVLVFFFTPPVYQFLDLCLCFFLALPFSCSFSFSFLVLLQGEDARIHGIVCSADVVLEPALKTQPLVFALSDGDGGGGFFYSCR